LDTFLFILGARFTSAPERGKPGIAAGEGMSRSSSSSAKTAHDLYTCPHLGMLDDTTTTTAFPSEVNHCLHCQSACVPSRQQQQEYCLSQRYRDCPILHHPAPARLPANLRWAQNPEVSGSNPLPATKSKPESVGLWFLISPAHSGRHFSKNGGISYEPQFAGYVKIQSFTFLSQSHRWLP
jgi:hypothetical protein